MQKKKVKGYNYYHCTHKKKEFNCKQKSVEEKEITKNIIDKLRKLKIHPLFLEWSLEYLDSQKGIEKTENKIIEKNKDTKLKEFKDQLSELTMMRVKKLINDDLFIKEKNNLEKKIERLSKVDENKQDEDKIIKSAAINFRNGRQQNIN